MYHRQKKLKEQDVAANFGTGNTGKGNQQKHIKDKVFVDGWTHRFSSRPWHPPMS